MVHEVEEPQLTEDKLDLSLNVPYLSDRYHSL